MADVPGEMTARMRLIILNVKERMNQTALGWADSLSAVHGARRTMDKRGLLERMARFKVQEFSERSNSGRGFSRAVQCPRSRHKRCSPWCAASAHASQR